MPCQMMGRPAIRNSGLGVSMDRGLYSVLASCPSAKRESSHLILVPLVLPPHRMTATRYQQRLQPCRIRLPALAATILLVREEEVQVLVWDDRSAFSELTISFPGRSERPSSQRFFFCLLHKQPLSLALYTLSRCCCLSCASPVFHWCALTRQSHNPVLLSLNVSNGFLFAIKAMLPLLNHLLLLLFTHFACICNSRCF